MSEFINNISKRQVQLKNLIKRLHDGATVEEVKEEFAELTKHVTAKEITEMEQALVNEGMKVEDIQRLCDVHASVFKGSIEDIHSEENNMAVIEGHPIHTFKLENRAIEAFIATEVSRALDQYINTSDSDMLLKNIEQLASIEKHYSRKENLLFPYMEKYDITAPPQVMWGVDDDIRLLIKGIINNLKSSTTLETLVDQVKDVMHQIKEMIFKEEEIMFPLIMETFTQTEWIEIEKASAEIGYTFLKTVKRWLPILSDAKEVKIEIQKQEDNNEIKFDAGSLSPEEINAILNTVPVDMTFVDKNDRVKYFTQGKERIFDRPKTIIGREVKHCHPPKSVHIVEQIVEDLKSGKKDNEDFWIRMGDMFVYIRYFAVRSKSGEFLGTLEVSQDIKPITELEGEKRLRDSE